jgi:hypothetical protein
MLLGELNVNVLKNLDEAEQVKIIIASIKHNFIYKY